MSDVCNSGLSIFIKVLLLIIIKIQHKIEIINIQTDSDRETVRSYSFQLSLSQIAACKHVNDNLDKISFVYSRKRTGMFCPEIDGIKAAIKFNFT